MKSLEQRTQVINKTSGGNKWPATTEACVKDAQCQAEGRTGCEPGPGQGNGTHRQSEEGLDT